MDAQLYRDFGENEDGHWWFTARREIVRGFIKGHLPQQQGNRILDVGCGTGGMLPLLQQFGTVTGLEGEPAAIEYAKKRAPGCELIQGTLPDGLPKDGRFDLITAFDVIEHLADPVESLRRMRELIAPGGRLLVTVPAFMALWSHHDELNHHHRRYTRGMLEDQLSSAGFALLRWSYFNSMLFAPIAAVRLLQRVVPRKEGQSDFSMVAAPVNRLLHEVFSLERFVVPRIPLPLGVSLIGIARVGSN